MSDEGYVNGRQGEAGVAGRQGEAGEVGAAGRQGIPGETGVAGVAGAPGPPGERGERGRRGMARQLRWAPAIGYVILALTLGFLVFSNRQLIRENQQLIEHVAMDCVDVTGDLSYRHVLEGLIRMNHDRNPFTGKPLPANTTLDQRRKLTAELLQRGLDEAGKVPPCIEARGP
jgi:hypothetical protein